jgi:hypothetical protein
MNMRLDAREIARALPVRQVLRALGLRVRNSKRADCPLCKGNSNGTIAYTERFWHCHRCHEGGDVFSIVRAVNRYDFRGALRFTAELAGIRLPDHRSVDFRRQWAARKRQLERLETAAQKLAALERATLIECRDRLLDCERVLATPGPWDDRQWQRAQAACVLRDDYVLPAYTLLSFATPVERARFALHPETQAQIAAAVRRTGYVRTAEDRRVEVPQ